MHAFSFFFVSFIGISFWWLLSERCVSASSLVARASSTKPAEARWPSDCAAHGRGAAQPAQLRCAHAHADRQFQFPLGCFPHPVRRHRERREKEAGEVESNSQLPRKTRCMIECHANTKMMAFRKDTNPRKIAIKAAPDRFCPAQREQSNYRNYTFASWRMSDSRQVNS
jgi:hypothetical protein